MSPIPRPDLEPSGCGCAILSLAVFVCGVGALMADDHTLWVMACVGFGGLGVASVVVAEKDKEALRAVWRSLLLDKYRDETVVEKIMAGEIWQGQTEEQVFEALGRPVDIDEKVLKARVRQTMKYGEDGKKRFKLRVIVENGVVVGWEKRE